MTAVSAERAPGEGTAMTHRTRILDVRTLQDLEAELDRIGAPTSERRRIAEAGIGMVIKVNAVPLDSAAVIGDL